MTILDIIALRELIIKIVIVAHTVEGGVGAVGKSNLVTGILVLGVYDGVGM